MPILLRSLRGMLPASLFALALFGAAPPARADEPTPTTIDLAGKILQVIGLKSTVDSVVPSLLGEIERNLLAAHPEMKEPLHATLLAIMPDLIKSEGGVLSDVSRVMAAGMSEADLKASLAFFESPAGKKYLSAQEPVLQQLQSSGVQWREQMAASLLPRIREEMKKKGFDL